MKPDNSQDVTSGIEKGSKNTGASKCYNCVCWTFAYVTAPVPCHKHSLSVVSLEVDELIMSMLMKSLPRFVNYDTQPGIKQTIIWMS